MLQKKYRRNVAAVVINQQGQLLSCKRLQKNSKWSGVASPWQLPQGGIDEGEDETMALYRELYEETGIKNFTILDKLEETIKYDWPEELHTSLHCGQEQFFFLVRIAPNETINLTILKEPEFEEYQWVKIDDFLNTISGFKAQSYRVALELFRKRNSVFS